ncbi:MAG: toxin-antitoxin system HicB family antitoxin [Rubripirellula sp.]
MDQQENNPALRYANDPEPAQVAASPSRLPLSPPNVDLPIDQRGKEVLRLATEAFAKTGSWVVFYREMLGSEGVVRRLFPETSEMRTFEDSSEFAELQEMVAAMRSQDSSKGDATEPERMITIRLPKSLHDALRIEAEEMNLSINKLCISKLLQRIEGRFIPIQQGRRRGRRPGPQGPRKKTTTPVSSETHLG